ncbi:MAG: hypothetical protein M1829_003378 [Trizodia sp. TS-e1964]|nr:MAG: hypothetical protein M1829_003378 [Trizodia sp. TS-e1964]
MLPSLAQRLSRAVRNAHLCPAAAPHQPRLQPARFSSAPSTTPQRPNRPPRTLPSFSLAGRTAVVTGGARGLGLAMARALVESGADVALVDLNHEEAEKQASLLLHSFKANNPSEQQLPTISAHFADVSSPASVSTCMGSILRSHAHIDHLVTSAGLTATFPAESYPLAQLRKVWGVNVDGTFFFAGAVARHLKARRAPGSMVFVASISARIVNVPQMQAPYNASKAAVRQLAASMAVEWAPAGIRVNCISPGYMVTPL